MILSIPAKSNKCYDTIDNEMLIVRSNADFCQLNLPHCTITEQEGLAVSSIARDDRSTLPGDDPSPLPGMHRDHNAR